MSAMPLAVAAGDGALAILELGALLAVLGLLARLADRLELSPIPFYLLAGLPFGAGGIGPIFGGDFTEVGATIGVILLLFMLGLEYTAQELRDNVRRNLPSGAADLVLNAAPGALAGLLLGWGPVAVVALAGITYISSSGVIAKALNDLEWIGNRETPTILSILVIEDLAMAVYLPVLAVLIGGGGLMTGVLSVSGALAAAGVALLVALRWGHLVSRVLGAESKEVAMLSTLGLVLLVGGAAEQMQVSAGVGAFLVGIAVSGEAADRVHDVLSPLRDLFAAVFFVFFGLQIDPGGIPGVLLPAAALALASIGTKGATGWLAAKRAGVRIRARVRAAAALTPRGEFSIIIASLAVAGGLNPDLGPLAAAYVLLTAVAGPLLMRASDPLGRVLAERGRAGGPERGPVAAG